MRTRNSYFPNNSNVTIPRRRNKGRAPNIVEPELRTIVAPMAERTMEELLRAPTEGMNTTSRESFSKMDERIDKLADQISTLVKIVSKKVVTPAPVKAVEEHMDPSIPTILLLNKGSGTEKTEEDNELNEHNFQGSTAQIPPPVTPIPISEPDVPKSLPKPNIPYPSCRNDQKSYDKASNQMEKIFRIFQDLRFDISFTDALLLMPRFALMNKDKLLELAKILLNENCSAMLLKKLPEKLGDPDKFLIP
ncbi:hypothetical protein Tco_0753259 [Tanacetum coccineum]